MFYKHTLYTFSSSLFLCFPIPKFLDPTNKHKVNNHVLHHISPNSPNLKHRHRPIVLTTKRHPSFSQLPQQHNRIGLQQPRPAPPVVRACRPIRFLETRILLQHHPPRPQELLLLPHQLPHRHQTSPLFLSR